MLCGGDKRSILDFPLFLCICVVARKMSMTVIDRDDTLFQRWDSGLRTFFGPHCTLTFPFLLLHFLSSSLHIMQYPLTGLRGKKVSTNTHISYSILSKWFFSVVFGLGLWHIMKHLCTLVLPQIITMQPMEVYLNIVNRVSLEIMNKEYGVHFNRVCFMFSSTLHLQLLLIPMYLRNGQL